MAALYFIWGSTYLGIRYALQGGFTPFWLGAIRFLLAGGLLYGILRLRGVPAPTGAQWRNAALLGLLLLAIGNGLVNVALQSVSSGMTAVAVASAPLWMGIFAALRGERLTRLEWLGLGVGFVGVLWLNAGSSLRASPVGMVALLIGSIAWSYGSIWSRGRDLAPSFMNAAAQMICGGVMMLVVALLLGERMSVWPTPASWAALAYLVVFGSGIGYCAYIWLLDNVRPALASSYAYVNPAVAVVLGTLLAGEYFRRSELMAMSVILLGVLAITLAKAMKGRR